MPGAANSSISVVIPAHNAAATLYETLASVARQTLVPGDVTVVDDASTDGTRAIAEGFRDDLPNLQVICLPENVGVSDARNVGIGAGTGAYIATIDADDIWHPTYLAKMIDKLESVDGCGFVYCFFRKIDADGRVVAQPGCHLVDGRGFYQLLVWNFIGNGSNTVYRRDLIERLGGFDVRLAGSEDRLLQLRAAWVAPLTHVPERLVGYRNVPGSLSKQFRRMADDGVAMMKFLTETCADIDRDHWRSALSRRHWVWAKEGWRRGFAAPHEIAGHCLVAAAYDPSAVTRSTLAFLRRVVLRSPSREPPRLSLVGKRFMDVDPAAAWYLPAREEILESLLGAAQRDAALGRA